MDYLVFSQISILFLFIFLVFLCFSINFLGGFSFYIFSLLYFFLFLIFFFTRYCLCSYGDVILFRWVELPGGVDIFYSGVVNAYNLEFSIILLFLGMIIHYFSYYYFQKDPDFVRFSLLLGFFILFMLLLINTNSIIFTFVAWEGVGLLSFLLVCFWYSKINTFKSGMKVLFYNRIGDFFFFLVVGLFLYFFKTDNFVDFFALNGVIPTNFFSLTNKIFLDYFIGFSLVFVILSKSAQFGFHIWLLEAMEAPLPASSLIHSATLVCSGIVLFFKSYNFIVYYGSLSKVVLLWSSLSACFLSLSALLNYDIKKILAYSTGSHVSLMLVLSVSGGGLLGFTYTLVHASTKVFIFLLFGFIINVNNGVRDLRKMGGFFIFNNLSILGLVGVLFLASFPFFPLAFLKDASSCMLLDGTFWGDLCLFFILLASTFNYMYMGRLFLKIFFGDRLSSSSVYFLNFSFFKKLSLVRYKSTKFLMENKILVFLLLYIFLVEFGIFYTFQIDFLFPENRIINFLPYAVDNGSLRYLAYSNTFFFLFFFFKSIFWARR